MLFLYHTYYASLFVTAVFCLYAYKYLDANFKWLLPFILFCILFETASEFDWLIINHTNASATNFEEIIEFILYTRFLLSLSDRRFHKRKAYVCFGIILLFGVINMVVLQGFWKMNTITMVLQSLFIITLVVNYYYRTLDKAEKGLELIKHPPFLIVTGLLFYFLGKFFLYTCFSYMAYKNNYDFYILAATIPGLSNLLLNFMLMYAFFCARRNKLKTTNGSIPATSAFFKIKN